MYVHFILLVLGFMHEFVKFTPPHHKEDPPYLATTQPYHNAVLDFTSNATVTEVPIHT